MEAESLAVQRCDAKFGEQVEKANGLEEESKHTYESAHADAKCSTSIKSGRGERVEKLFRMQELKLVQRKRIKMN